MELSVLKNSRVSEDNSHINNYSSVKPERDIEGRSDQHNCTVHDYGTGENYRGYVRESLDANRHNETNLPRSSGRKNYQYERPDQSY